MIKKKTECQGRTEPEYEELPPVKEEKKRKGLFRLSRAKHTDTKQETKSDRKNSTNSTGNRFSMRSELAMQNMLNPRDRVKKDDPANKYPFYEEVPVVQVGKRAETHVNSQSVQNGASSPYYHVLEVNDGAVEQRKETTSAPHYFVLEQVCFNEYSKQITSFLLKLLVNS